MLIGTLQIKLRIPEANSLKVKRFVIQSVVDRIRGKFNLSVSEIGNRDSWQSALLGVAVIGNEQKFMNQVLSKVMDLLRGERRLEVIDSRLEFF